MRDEFGKLKVVVTDDKTFNSGAVKDRINMKLSTAAKSEKEKTETLLKSITLGELLMLREACMGNHSGLLDQEYHLSFPFEYQVSVS